jgi:hypothetical protein
MVLRLAGLPPARHGTEIAALGPATRLDQLPRWYAPTADDRQKDAQTLSTLAALSISRNRGQGDS